MAGFDNIGMGLGMNTQQVPDYASIGLGGGMARDQNSYKFSGGVNTNAFGGAPGAPAKPNLGFGGMGFLDKSKAVLGGIQTATNLYGAYGQQKTAREQKRQFNANFGMQKAAMSGNLATEYNTASNPTMLAGSEQEYLAKYGL